MSAMLIIVVVVVGWSLLVLGALVGMSIHREATRRERRRVEARSAVMERDRRMLERERAVLEQARRGPG